MDEEKQAEAATGTKPASGEAGSASPMQESEPDAPEFLAREREAAALAIQIHRRVEIGLSIWLVTVFAIGLPAIMFGQYELAALAGFAGLFVAAQASDVDTGWVLLHYALVWIVPLGAAGLFAGLATVLARGELSPLATRVANVTCVVGAAASLLSLLPPVSAWLGRVLFRVPEPSRTIRLASRAVLVAVLLAPPCMIAAPVLLDILLGEGRSLFDNATLGGGLAGYIVLALASVGFLLRRDFRATLERLGISALRPWHVLLIAVGVIALFALNGGMDALERVAFPALHARDQEINRAIATGLSPARALLLGLSAGIGEEITMRGALQPRLGVLRTSLVFASLHVQYTWFGMLVILMLGLTLGVLRKRGSTTVSMAVHAIYDAIAALHP